MASASASSWQAVDEGSLKDIYDSDQAMYPAPQLTYDRLKSWVDACPELCICLQRGNSERCSHSTAPQNNAHYGLVIVMPLRQTYWDTLRHGDIEEHDVDAAEMFPNNETHAHGEGNKTKVGLHVFHIERFPGFASISKNVSFTPLALNEIRGRVMNSFPSWEVLGYSALTATKEGNAAFKRLGFVPSDSSSGSTLLHQSAEMVERMGNKTFSGVLLKSSKRHGL